jgi:hypothetical protein
MRILYVKYKCNIWFLNNIFLEELLSLDFNLWCQMTAIFPLRTFELTKIRLFEL